MDGGSVMTMDESDIPAAQVRITSRLIDSLYTEAMLLADEARSYFDDAGRDERSTLEPFARVGFACESLKVTTRIMHIVAWLLTPSSLLASSHFPRWRACSANRVRLLGHCRVTELDNCNCA
jgi:regulator of CtrA degradation